MAPSFLAFSSASAFSRAICAAAESYLGYRTFGFFFSFAAAMFRAFYVGTTNTRILSLIHI